MNAAASDETALLAAAVKAAPHDATARLVYADALDAVGVVRQKCPECKSSGRPGMVWTPNYDGGLFDRFWNRCPKCLGVGGLLDHTHAIEAALQRVLACPESDDYRLAYADAVEPVDKERAEFIRWQCDTAEGWRCGVSLVSPKFLEKLEGWRFQAGPLGAHTKSRMKVALGLAGLLPEPSGIHSGYCRLERGFIDRVEYSADDWLTHGDTIRARHPVTRVRLTTRPELELVGAGPLTEQDWINWRLKGRNTSHSITYEMATRPTTELVTHLLNREWPGVTFELPPSLVGPVDMSYGQSVSVTV